MKNLVFESLDELFENKKAKPESIEKTHNKYEKGKTIKISQDKKEKGKQAIGGLKKELAKAKKPGAFKSTAEKNVKIKELQDKIKAWENKIK